jgi:hypothetical protein
LGRVFNGGIGPGSARFGESSFSSFDELSAMRVGYKSGTVSKELLKELGM